MKYGIACREIPSVIDGFSAIKRRCLNLGGNMETTNILALLAGLAAFLAALTALLVELRRWLKIWRDRQPKPKPPRRSTRATRTAQL